MQAITIATLSRCSPATAKTLQTAGIASNERLLSAGLAQNLHNIIDDDVAARLVNSNISVPEDRKLVLGEGFSKLVKYNEALDDCFFAEDDVAEALWAQKSSLDPFRRNILPSEEYFSNKFGLSGDYAVLGVGAFIRENLALTMPKETTAKLTEHLRTVANIKSELRLHSAKADPAQSQLTMLANNADSVLEAYRKTLEFREDFREQIRFIAIANSVNSNIGRAMMYFLNAPLPKHLANQDTA